MTWIEPATPVQRQALEQLEGLAAAGPLIEVLGCSLTADCPPGTIAITVSLNTTGIAHTHGGIRLRSRERFDLVVGSNYPFDPPAVWVDHHRWAGTPHVQWRRHICLYAAPSLEWNPSEGMRGLIGRLLTWLEQAAADNLDPDGQPLHPPVAYATAAEAIVVRADIGDLAPASVTTFPRTEGGEGPPRARILVALGRSIHRLRVDLCEWADLAHWQRRSQTLPVSTTGTPGHSWMLAVLLDREIGFEYPRSLSEVIAQLEQVGPERKWFLDLLADLTYENLRLAGALLPDAPDPLPTPTLYVLIGTPSRRPTPGVIRHHLVAWKADGLSDLAFVSALRNHPDPVVAADAQRARAAADEMIASSAAEWITVMEARPEVTVRRDQGSPETWLQGKKVLVLGCGALGAPMVEHCLRAGAHHIWAVDNANVHPGILVRQPYADADIGSAKVHVLAERLNRLGLAGVVEAMDTDAKTLLVSGIPPVITADLIIDATADNGVRSAIELARSRHRSTWPPFLTAVVGHDAGRGIVAISKPGATGAGRDIFRRIGLAALREPEHLHDVTEDFTAADATFQPEPGCSSPTFTGSHGQLVALAAGLLHAGLSALVDRAPNTDSSMEAAIIRLADIGGGRTDWLRWANDHIVSDDSGIEVRFSALSMAQMRGEARRGRRVRARDIETGGMLLGELDDACRCLWVDVATGPPPDSELSPSFFLHGLIGTQKTIEHHRKLSGGTTTYQGMWHIHPGGSAEPSKTDRGAMEVLVDPGRYGVPRALLAILGAPPISWDAWLDEGEPPTIYATVVRRTTDQPSIRSIDPPPSHQTQSWTGGWRTRPASPGPVPQKRRRRRMRRLHLRRRE